MSKKLVRSREYVDGYTTQSDSEAPQNDSYEKKLYEYICRPPDDASPEAEEDYKRRLEKFMQYKRGITANLRRKMTRLTYDRLSDFMAITGMTLQDIFRVLEIEDGSEIISEDVEVLSRLCDFLSVEDREYLKDIAVALSPDWWMSDELADLQPTQRLRAVYGRLQVRHFCQNDDPLIAHLINAKRKNVSLPFNQVCGACRSLGIPVHWAMRLGPESTVAGNTPQTQFIMDAYEFMSSANKKLFFRLCVDAAKDGGGWSSVKVDPPEDGERVLAYSIAMEGTDVGPVSVEWGWACKQDGSDIDYWMPTQKLPKKQLLMEVPKS